MNQATEQPEKEKRIHPLFKRPTPITEAPSLGEILLPFLFAAMESSWIDAILICLSGFGLFQTYQPLMPLWAPYVLLLGPQVIITLVAQRTAKSST